MAFVHGKGTHVTINSVNLSAYLTEASQSFDDDTHETTTFGKNSKEYLPGLQDGTISLSGNLDPALDSSMAAMRGVVVPFIYGPEGSTTGKRKYSGNCIRTSYEVSNPVGDLVTFSAEFQITGDVTVGTF